MPGVKLSLKRRSLLALSVVCVAMLSSRPAATLIYVNGTANTGQNLLLRRDGDRLVLVNQQSRAVVASAPAGSTQRVVVVGADDRNDTLTLDLTNPLSLPRGIDYDGGARGWDTLVLTGGSVQRETVTQLTPHDGVFDLDGLALRYTNLEPITDTVPAASFTVTGTPGADTVTIADGPGAGQATISSPTFESVTFSNKGNVIFDGQGGGDSFTLSNPTTPNELASFIIQNVATVDQTDTFNYQWFGVSATGTVNLNSFSNNVANIEITTQTGDINYSDVDGATIGGVSAALSGLRVTDEGSINFRTNGVMTLADTDGADIVRSGATGGNVILQAFGAGSDIAVTVNNKAAISPAGLVSVASDRDILLGTMGSNFANDVLASSDVSLNAQQDIAISGHTEVFSDAFGNGTGGTATANAVRDFLLSDATGANARFGSTGFGGGTVQVFAPGRATLTAPSAAALVSTSGPVSVTTRHLIIDATSGISAPAQTVSIISASGALDFGSTTDVGVGLELSDAEADRITAPFLIVEGSGSLTVTQPITFAGELTVRSGSLFSATGAGSLSAPTLRFQDMGGSPRTWTINATAVTITPGTAIPYSGVTSLFANGGFGDDTFAVTPAPSTTITVTGRLPDLPASPGDTLNVSTSGTTTPFLTYSQTETGFEGSYTFGNRAPVNFSDIETLNAATDLGITKTDGASSETPGTPVTYTIVATNTGALGIAGATVTDSFPAALTGVNWTCTASAGSSCPASGSGALNVLVNLAAGGTATFTVTGTINPAATGTLSNTATIDAPAGTNDTNADNNSATDADTLLVLTTLTTSASAGVVLGGQVQDTATLANGTSPAGTITFNLYGPNNATCAGTPVFTNPVPVAGNGSYDSANFTPTLEGTYRWIASYSGDAVNAAATGACNGANESVTVTTSADVALLKTGPSPVVAGSNITYTITATNNGPNPALSVTVTDTLSAGTALVSSTPTQGSCGGTTTVTCNLGTIANGGSATITLVVSTTGATPGSISNTASVTATTPDPTPGNNSSTANTTVTPSADVAVTKTGPATVVAGSNVTYTVTAANNGPSAAQNFTVNDTLPGGTAFVSATPTQGSCGGTTTVTCNLGTIANGATATITLVVSTTGATPGSISNTASGTAATGDPVPGNNSGTAVTSVTPLCSALIVTPSVLPPPIAGEPYSQTFAATNGTAPVTFTLTGTLPAGLSFGGATLSGVPTQRGAFPVTLDATDANGCRGSFPYTVTVSRDRVLAVGMGAGGGAGVRTYGVHRWSPRLDVTAYNPPFNGGVSVALGDTDGDGFAEVITGAGPGGTPLVRVLDSITGAERLSFLAYDAALSSGIEVASGDVNGDGIADIITVPGYGGPPIVRVFDGLTGAGVRQFFGMPPTWTNGLHVAAGDVNGDGLAEVIVGSGPFGPPLVQVFDAGGGLLGQFLAYHPNFDGGVYVASGDVNGDGFADIVTGPGLGGGPHVRVFDSITGNQIAGPLGGFFAYDPAFAGGVRVAAGDLDGDGFAEVIAGAGPGGGPHVRVWDGASGIETYGAYAFDSSFLSGVFVAGPPSARRMAIDTLQAGGTPSSLRIAGWALEETSTAGPGTDAIHAWAYPIPGGPALFVGAASARVARADVAAVFGGEFLMSGFDFTGTLAPGSYDLVIFVRNDTTYLFDLRRVVRITMP